MKTFYNISILILFSITVLAQSIPDDIKLYNAVIKFQDKTPTIRGTFHSFNDSLIFIANSSIKEDIISGNYKVVQVPIKNIEIFKVRRKGRIGRSTAIGFGAGATMGIALGISTGCSDCDNNFADGYTKSTMSAVFGIPLSILGSGFGALIGIGRVPLIKDGTLTIYANQNKSLSKYSIIKHEINEDKL